jgi:hypothetical protein
MEISGITVSPGAMALVCILERLDGAVIPISSLPHSNPRRRRDQCPYTFQCYQNLVPIYEIV